MEFKRHACQQVCLQPGMSAEPGRLTGNVVLGDRRQMICDQESASLLTEGGHGRKILSVSNILEAEPGGIVVWLSIVECQAVGGPSVGRR